jgi:hypothetical protein
VKIAFVGKKGTGKTTAARYLQTQHKFTKMRMDDGIVKFLRSMYLYRANSRIPWRDRLKFYDAIYKLDPNIHIEYLLRRMASPTFKNDVVIDEVRYINEVQRLKKAGFTIIRISGGKPNTLLVGMDSAAAGTTLLQEYFGSNFDAYSVDYSIVNDQKENLFKTLDKIVDKEHNKPSL